jgi:hypothetical protein
MEYIKPEPLYCLNSYFDSNNFNIEKIVKPLDYLSFDVNFNSQKCIAYKKLFENLISHFNVHSNFYSFFILFSRLNNIIMIALLFGINLLI